MTRKAYMIILIFLIGHEYCRDNSSYPFSDNYKVVITGFGSDKKGAFCENFRLTEKQVKQFFRKAVCISSEKLHNEFDWLPCFITGIIIDKGIQYKWEIRLIGIGKIVTPKGDIIWLGCQKYDDMF